MVFSIAFVSRSPLVKIEIGPAEKYADATADLYLLFFHIFLVLFLGKGWHGTLSHNLVLAPSVQSIVERKEKGRIWFLKMVKVA